MELKMLRSRVGASLLGVSVVDDTLTVVGISLFLALLGEAASGQANGLLIVLTMPLYLVIASVVGIWLIPKLDHHAENLPVSRQPVASTFIMVLLHAWAAEALGGMAGIMGGFVAARLLAWSPLDAVAVSNLIGREEELAFLNEYWRGAEAGQGRLSVISGEAEGWRSDDGCIKLPVTFWPLIRYI